MLSLATIRRTSGTLPVPPIFQCAVGSGLPPKSWSPRVDARSARPIWNAASGMPLASAKEVSFARPGWENAMFAQVAIRPAGSLPRLRRALRKSALK